MAGWLTTVELRKKFVKPVQVGTMPISKYVESGKKLLKAAEIFRVGEDEEMLFVFLMRLVDLFSETLPKHEKFKDPRCAKDVHELRKLVVNHIDEIEELKEKIDKRAEMKKKEEREAIELREIEEKQQALQHDMERMSIKDRPDAPELQDLGSVSSDIGTAEYATSDPGTGMDLLTGAATAVGIPSSANNQGWRKGAVDSVESEQEEESDEKVYLSASYPSVDSSVPSIPVEKILPAEETEAHEPGGDSHTNAAFQEAAPAPQLPVPAYQHSASVAPESDFAGHNGIVPNQPGLYSGPSGGNSMGMNQGDRQHVNAASNGIPHQVNAMAATPGQQAFSVDEANYWEYQRCTREEHHRRAHEERERAVAEHERLRIAQCEASIAVERQNHFEQERIMYENRARQIAAEKQSHFEQEQIMKENRARQIAAERQSHFIQEQIRYENRAKRQLQMELHAKAIEEAKALEAKRLALLTERAKREREYQEYEEARRREEPKMSRSQSNVGAREHVPNINQNVPKPEVAKLDHAKLDERVKAYGMKEKKVLGDGNCQFRALSDQLHKTPDKHERVRRDVISQLKSYPDEYSAYVPDDYSTYVSKMGRDGEWGDHVTLKAAADYYGMKINVMSSYPGDQFLIKIVPMADKASRVLWLSFWAEVHYNSLYTNA